MVSSPGFDIQISPDLFLLPRRSSCQVFLVRLKFGPTQNETKKSKNKTGDALHRVLWQNKNKLRFNEAVCRRRRSHKKGRCLRYEYFNAWR
ncbi:hypothetical protein CEXT_421851 [Caerostris extrusa]|uniref:Uncharacterized protein n=1 Tax=Caerostris extrusa TaxID=172846 RepID=A0AAV4UIM6_CAEEX|nr:hypothetical protein CEXT_421851 [Caerostris extrusa]